ncbi:hypothetical protein J2S44_008574, partial [Catenuloplanes niger]|nr:hypothetical protein [Catenuloplanes niger]
MESVVVPRPARVARPGLPSGTIVAPVPPVDVGTDADTATDLPADTGADLPADTAAHLPADTTAHLPADTVADLPAGVVAYLRELAAVDARARQAAAAQRAVLEERHPAPGRLHEVPDG